MSSTEELLKAVADIAAICFIDLDHNLAEAEKEYMDGKIAKGALKHVSNRHGNLHIALRNAGYTEKNEVFGFPCLPTPPKKES